MRNKPPVVNAVLVVLGVTMILLGCGGKSAPMVPGARLIQGGDVPLWSTCDKGHRLYFSDSGLVGVLPLGCVDGAP